MTSNEFLDKLIESKYDEMSFRHFQIMDTYSLVFRFGSKYHQLIEKISKNPSKRFDDETKNELLTIINDKKVGSFFYLNVLDNNPIDEKDCVIKFKETFYSNLDKMNNNQLCHLIDSIGKMSVDHKISFFGSNYNAPVAYHGLNEVISISLGYKLVFGFFGRSKDYRKRYYKININNIKRGLLIDRIKEYCKMYFYLLEGLSETILETKEEELDKKSLTYAFNKKLNKYLSLVDEQHKLLKTKGQKVQDKWKYLLDDIETGVDEDDD